MSRWALALLLIAWPVAAQWVPVRTPTPRPTVAPTATPRPTAVPTPTRPPAATPTPTPTPPAPPGPTPVCPCDRTPLLRLHPDPLLVGQPAIGEPLRWPDGAIVDVLIYRSVAGPADTYKLVRTK